MAQHTATARSAPQGKGKKAGLSVSISTKPAARIKGKRALKPVRKISASRRPVTTGASVTHLDAVVRVGTAITFAPTGERLRVAKIENGKITFEKLP
jgi:hypothetical protein